jgi:type II secretory pathway component PulF
MKLAYKAYDQSGQEVCGTIDSTDTMTATETLSAKGLFVAHVGQETTRSPYARTRRQRRPLWRTGQRLKAVAIFTRQLGVLISSGTPLVEALSALERQAKAGPWRDTIQEIRRKVEEGSSLSEALENHPSYFGSIYQSLVSAGESSGYLVDMLDRLAVLKQKQLRIRNAIMGSLIYPSLLIVLALSLLSLLLIFVVPRFAGLFASLDVPLPPSTKVLVWISDCFRRYWFVMLAVLAGSIVGVVTYFRSAQGRLVWDRALLRCPLFGGMIKNFATARIVRLLGVLLSGHVPVLTALILMRRATGNSQYEALIRSAEEYVSRGEPLSLAFADTPLISPSVHEAIRSGERSGQMHALLHNIAEFLEDDNEVTIRSLTSIIEPVILIGMGILVGLMAVSMFMPLFDLTAMTQAG